MLIHTYLCVSNCIISTQLVFHLHALLQFKGVATIEATKATASVKLFRRQANVFAPLKKLGINSNRKIAAFFDSNLKTNKWQASTDDSAICNYNIS